MSGSVDEADRRLLRLLDDGFRRIAELAGPHLVCRTGCADCCLGPFPVTRLDARRLRRGLAALAPRDPARAAALAARAARAVTAMHDGFPGEPASGRLSANERALDAFFERHAGLPCPVLDPATGSCELYPARPVACRTYGPPLGYDGEDAPACRLCFRDAPPPLLERCRYRPDPDGLEEAILARLGVAPGGDWETLIAHALRGPAG